MNINSVRNKLKDLELFLGGVVDVLTLSETKLDVSFPCQQFLMDGYKKPFRLDITSKSGGLLVYVRSTLPARQLNRFEIDQNFQILCLEISLHYKKWFLLSFYRNPKSNLQLYLDKLSDVLDYYCMTYDNILVMGDLNAEPSHPIVETFLNVHDFYCHINQKTCWKSAEGTCIDLIFSNQKYSFQHTGAVETGISDHHALVYTMLKAKYVKRKAKEITYRDYRNFCKDNFISDLNYYLMMSSCTRTYANFESIFCEVLSYHAPFKTKFLRANNKPHMSKQLRKAIMTRSRLKNKANKTNSQVDMANYRRQRNFVVNLNRQAKKAYISSIGPKGCSKFWDTFKPFFSDKGHANDVRIQLLENNNLVTNEEDIASIFNKYFNTITSKLNIPSWPFKIMNIDPISNIVNNYMHHPSIVAIKQKFPHLYFDFEPVDQDTVAKVITSLIKSKAVGGEIPVKMLQLSVDLCAPVLASCFNHALSDCEFPAELKLADIIPCLKKGDMHDKANYRPISLLPSVSKIFEKIIVTQIAPLLDQIFSKFLCGYRRGHSTQHALLKMLMKWQACLANKSKVGAILMDLSKAFDCLSHELLIAKLKAYGFGRNSLRFLLSYLCNRKQRVRCGNISSEWLELNLGVPQGSVLGPILFNLFLNDLFFIFEKNDICNFADDNSLYVCGPSLDFVKNCLQDSAIEILNWFDQNSLVANPAKFQIIFPGSPNLHIELNLNGHIIKNSSVVKLLGIFIDDKLSFLPHIKGLTLNANNKIKALLRLNSFLTQSQRDILFHSFIASLFNYCPLIWMFCSKQANSLLRRTHHRALRARFSDFSSSYEDLLLRGNMTSIHGRNLKLMLEEVFKSFHGLGPPILHDIFHIKNLSYSLRSGLLFELPISKTHVNSFEFRAIMAWNHLPASIKLSESISNFKQKLKTVDIYCRCKACI